MANCYVGGKLAFSSQSLAFASAMFNKNFLWPLVAIATTTVFIPSAVFAKPAQQSIAVNANLDKDKLEIKKVILKNLSSMNAGDSASFLSTVSPVSKEYKEIAKDPSSLKFLQALGLIYSVKEFDDIQVSNNQALAKVKVSATLGKTGLIPEMERLKKESGTKIGKDGSVTTTSIRSSVNYDKPQVSTGSIKLEKINGRWLIIAMLGNKFQPVAGTSVSGVRGTSRSGLKIMASDRKVFQQVFAKHLSALNQEKLGDYLATIDSTSPNYIAAKASTLKLFKNYDLKYELKNVEVLSLSKQEAVVKLIANVKKIKGGEFTDSQLVTINTVHKTNGQWRIYDTRVENISNLNTPKAKIAKR
jgi:hypothetical protein